MCELCEQAVQAEEAKEASTKVPSRILTRRTVLDHHPCSTYRSRFTQRFPEQVEVTVGLAVIQAMDWDWKWAAEELLSYDGYQAWRKQQDAALDVHEATMRPYFELSAVAYSTASAKRRERVAELTGGGMSHGKAVDLAWEEFDQDLEPSYAATAAVERISNKRYQQALAKAWAEIYISEGEQDSTND